MHGADGHTAHYSGTERCGSVWACPVCSAVIRHSRAGDIEQAAKAWTDQGKTLLFLTLTTRHTKDHRLATTLDAVLKAWAGTINGSPWKRKAEQIGLRGFVRATEVTWGQDNGWHPHLHVLAFLDKPLTPHAQADLETWIYDRWKARLVKRGLAEPTRLRGIDLRPVDGEGKLVAQYLAKVQGEKMTSTGTTRVHLELARGDMKSTRSDRGPLRLTPFELLDADCPLVKWPSASGTDATRAEELWCEYYAATKGRRAFHWSKGLREELLTDDEKTDDEILAEADQADRQFTIPGALWDQLKNLPDQLAAILEALDRSSVNLSEALAWGDLVVMGDGTLLVDPQTHRCFTPDEAADYFGRLQPDPPNPLRERPIIGGTVGASDLECAHGGP